MVSKVESTSVCRNSAALVTSLQLRAYDYERSQLLEFDQLWCDILFVPLHVGAAN